MNNFMAKHYTGYFKSLTLFFTSLLEHSRKIMVTQFPYNVIFLQSLGNFTGSYLHQQL